MTVKELINVLKQFDPDMLVAIGYDLYENINVSVKTWADGNYPNPKPDVDFVSIE